MLSPSIGHRLELLTRGTLATLAAPTSPCRRLGPDLSRVWQYHACLEKTAPEWHWGSALFGREHKQLHCDKFFPMMRCFLMQSQAHRVIGL